MDERDEKRIRTLIPVAQLSATNPPLAVVETDAQAPTKTPGVTPEPVATEAPEGSGLPCLGSALPLAAVGLA